MPVIDRIVEFGADMQAWRRDIHRHPEIAFQEHRTSDIVAEKLAAWGIEVHRGLAGTGVVGLLDGAHGNGRMIGLRADMDALPIQETNDFAHRSVHDGKMHACGHDGHTAMLLGAARYLAESRSFSGRVTLIFQPAEEGEGGARVMIEEGLFDQFPVEAVYGMHNMPGKAAGRIEVRPGPLLASSDAFDITVTGVGAHAAMPHQGVDPVVVAAQIVLGLQTIVSRQNDPVDSAVVSVTQVHTGDALNVIPEEAVIRGSVRAFRPETRDRIEREVGRISEGIAAAHGATAAVTYDRRYPALVNAPHETTLAAAAAADVVGEANVSTGTPPLMGSEDFAYMLQHKPGCYVLLGNGADGMPGGCGVHNPNYDFNDEIAVIGASYWARLVERLLPAGS